MQSQKDLLDLVQKVRLARRRNVHRFISFAGIFLDSTPPPSSIMESQRHFEKVNSPVISSSYWKDVKNAVWSHNSWQMTIITFSWQIQSQAQLINSHLVRPLLTKDFLLDTKLICEGHFHCCWRGGPSSVYKQNWHTPTSTAKMKVTKLWIVVIHTTLYVLTFRSFHVSV